MGKAVIDANEFIASPLRKAKGFLLAVDGINYSSELFSSPMGLKHWSDGYREMRLHPKAIDRTPAYLGKITETGEPIVFLVPPDLMSNPGITREEMLWLLENPDRMGNVTFVFGAYEIFPPEVISEFSRTRNRTEIRRLLGE